MSIDESLLIEIINVVGRYESISEEEKYIKTLELIFSTQNELKDTINFYSSDLRPTIEVQSMFKSICEDYESFEFRLGYIIPSRERRILISIRETITFYENELHPYFERKLFFKSMKEHIDLLMELFKELDKEIR